MIWLILAFICGGFSAAIFHHQSLKEADRRHEERVRYLEEQLRAREIHIDELSAQNKALREEIS